MKTAVSITKKDRLGLVHPALDAHTLGLTSIAQMLEDCGYNTVLAGSAICAHFNRPNQPDSLEGIVQWLLNERITALGFSYRLDPEEGTRLVTQLVNGLKQRLLLHAQGGPIKALYFAGLPRTCVSVREQVREVTAVFDGDDTPTGTLRTMGIDFASIPSEITENSRYDEDRFAFGRDLIRSGSHLSIRPIDRSNYPDFGTRKDSVLARLNHSMENHFPPLMRVHAGPYLQNRSEAVRLFLDWSRQLAKGGFLDILSIGTSQLTQSNFNENWADKPNGGGVPLNSPEEFASVWKAARPMLVRAYAGTKSIGSLARMNEETINIAWHALSLYWFCRMDGRGPYTVSENLEQQFEALHYIAMTGKPYEPNIAHHFAFRGADDVTCIVATVLAARAAKAVGIRNLILQYMLNTPRATWGIQDLAKARAVLALVREFQGPLFRVIFQPRAGLDAFSPIPEKAKAQLAAATALMDDIEPLDPQSPPLIHVVSYSEGFQLADPAIMNESIQITRKALQEYRHLRTRGEIDNMAEHSGVQQRTGELIRESRIVLKAIEEIVPDAHTAHGLYRVFKMGFLPVPYLWECRDEFENAVHWHTRMVRGAVHIVDENGMPIPVEKRMAMLLERLKSEK